MNPAVGSRAAASPPDDAATVALKGASLAFQKRPTPTSPSPHNQPSSSLTTGLRSSAKQPATTPDRGSRSRSRSPPLHNQQHSLEHYRENGALLAATSSVERAKSPQASPLRPRPAQHPRAPHEIASDAVVLPAGVVAARLRELGRVPAAAPSRATAVAAAAAGPPGALPSAPLAAVAQDPPAAGPAARPPRGVPSANLKAVAQDAPATQAVVSAAKSPSLIAATLAASRSASPTPPARRKPRHGQSGNASQDAEVVDSQPIPPTTSLISMFEVDEAGGKESEKSRRIPTSSPEPPVVRKSTRTSPTPIKQTTSVTTPSTRKSGSKQRGGKAQSHERPPTPPAVVDVTPAPAPTTPASASQAIVKAAASKPRVTPPKVKEKPKAESPSNTATPPKVISRAKSTTAMKKLDASEEVAPPRRRSRRPSPLRLSETTQDDRAPISPANHGLPTTPRQKSPTPHVISRSTPEVLSPKPTRIARAASLRSGTPPPTIILRPTSDVQSPPSPDPKKRMTVEKRPPTPPKPRNSQRLAPARPTSGRPRGNSDTPLSRATPVNSMWGLPIVSSTTSNTPKASKPQPPPPGRRESIVSAPPSPTHEPPRRRVTQSSPNPKQLNSMTNAIMASSLASSRLTPHNTGPSLPPPSLPTRQRSPHLLQTLRQPQSEPEDDHDRPRRNHRHRLHSSKHTHHEGSRRRWRDQVTDKERKRYEALWASNRGLLLTHESSSSPSASVGSGLGTDMSECVVNVVVRDIWRRSRLPAEELAEVWELVDRGRGAGYLTRQEFVVGMFLIDQRLRGRKLPPKVSDSIWGSVNGVTVLKPGPKKH